MLGGMLEARYVVAAIALCAVVPSSFGAPRPKGKVVRVERRRASNVTPRICDVQADRSGNCFGEQPKLGDLITLLDDSGVIGEARIIEVQPFALAGRGSKGCDGLWSVRTELLRGDLSNIGRTMGVVDPAMHPRLGKLVPKEQLQPPSGRSDESPAIGFDRDGDRTPDIILSQSTCDGQGSMCIEEWLRVNGKMERVHQVNFQTCGF
jgi:hypothetical protein